MNDRLTKQYPNGLITLEAKYFVETQEAIDTEIKNAGFLSTAIEKLKRYEDAEEYGHFYTTPCKLGDMLYTTVRARHLRRKELVYPCKVVFIGLNEEGGFVNVQYKNRQMWQFNFDDFGKRVFRTPEEVAEMLKREE